MHIGYTRNEYGTLVSKHRCDTCGEEFTLCPAVSSKDEGWENCLSPTCSSYSPDRDLDDVIEEGVATLLDGDGNIVHVYNETPAKH